MEKYFYQYVVDAQRVVFDGNIDEIPAVDTRFVPLVLIHYNLPALILLIHFRF